MKGEVRRLWRGQRLSIERNLDAGTGEEPLQLNAPKRQIGFTRWSRARRKLVKRVVRATRGFSRSSFIEKRWDLQPPLAFR